MMKKNKNGSSGNEGVGVLNSNENMVLDDSPVFSGLYLDILTITSRVYKKLEDDV